MDWQPLARGGFSTVWQARQQSLDRLVAVKVDHRTLADDKEQRRFLREAGAAGRLSGHPGIVTVHDAGILSDDRPYLVMDLCPGGSLTRWLKPEGRKDSNCILDVGLRIADALAAAHARGVLHRDVKPANILIDSYEKPGLADFGLAALPEPGIEMSVTLEGMTPAYAPKEVFYLQTPTEFGDVYSLAATLYALFDGKPPRWPDSGTASVPELLELQQHPIERLPQVPTQLMDVLMRALDDDPDKRPRAAEFRDLLAAVDLDASPPRGAAGLASAPAAAAVGAEPAAAAAEVGARPVPVSAAADGAEPKPLETAEPAAEFAEAGSAVPAEPVAPTPTPATASAAASTPSKRRPLTWVLIAAGLAATLMVVAALFTSGSSPGSADPPLTQGPALTAGPTPIPSPREATVSPSSEAPSNEPAPSTASSGSPASPDPSPAPAGFVDCSEQLGGTSYCVADPECWAGISGYVDFPIVATMEDCYATHVYQTYAAGQLSGPVQRQSELEARKEVKELCTLDNLNAVLSSERARKDWEIYPIPPQLTIKGDNLFRCLFGFGERDRPVKLNRP